MDNIARKYTCELSQMSLLCFVPVLFAQNDGQPISVNFDSDMRPDYDDVGTLTVFHAFTDRGEVKILATIASTEYAGVTALMNVLNTYFNYPEIHVDVPTGKALSMRYFQYWLNTLITEYSHSIKKNSEASGSVDKHWHAARFQCNNSYSRF